MKQPATFRIRSAYGVTRAYPVNQAAKLLCTLTGTTTLLPQNIGIIEDLGFSCINEINDTVIVPSLLY
jgi:hypothetical protein